MKSVKNTTENIANKAVTEETPPKRWSWMIRIIVGIFGILFICGCVVLAWVGNVAYNAPPLQDLQSIQFAQSSVIYDRTGEHPLYTIYGEENRKMVPFSEISDHMKKAMLAAEDADFYNHSGIDYAGLARSAWYLIKYREARGGGSTIDQQLIKNIVFGKDQTITAKIKRKIQEIVLVRQLESAYTKDEILNLYLNRVPFGRNAYGIERAAQVYFEKSAKELSIAESAFLAGLPQAPGRLSRRIYTELNVSTDMLEQYGVETYAKATEIFPTAVNKGRGMLGIEIELANGKKDFFPGRFEYVLGQMHQKGFITTEEYTAAQKQKSELLVLESRTDITAPHFVEYVRDQLEEQYDSEFLERGGLKIITSLDVSLQKKAEELVQEQGLKNAATLNARNAALISINPKTGEILSMVGSRDYFANVINGKTGELLYLSDAEKTKKLEEKDFYEFGGKVNITTSKRQVGSTFKPIAYATAFEKKGLAPSTILMDVQTNFGAGYKPNNFDFKFHGPVSVRKALGNSYNIPAVKSGIIAGVSNVFETAQKMGIHFSQSHDFYGSAIPLGVSEIMPLDLVRAYSTFANGGRRVDAHSILKVIDQSGNAIYNAEEQFAQALEDEERKAISPETAYLITDILSDNDARGEGWSFTLDIPGRQNGAKTGTTNEEDSKGRMRAHDGWVVGYTPQVVTAVWIGNNKGWEGNPRGVMASNASGLRGSGPIWKNFMIAAHEEKEKENFSRPAGIQTVKIVKYSGHLPTENTPESFITEGLFSKKFLPEQEDTSIAFADVVVTDPLPTLPNEFTPPEAIEKRAVLDFHAYFSEWNHWEKPVQEWKTEHLEEFIQEEEINVDGFLKSLPTETTTRYSKETQENSPEMRIISPANFGTVSPPAINVEADVEAKNGLSKLEFYWDDTLVVSRSSAPWTAKMRIDDAPVGSEHTIRVDAIDRLLYRHSSEIIVKIGEDTIPPELHITYPKNNSEIPINSTITIAADAIDRNSAVSRVVFSIDGESLSPVDRRAPFETQWTAPQAPGTHTLSVTAEDSSGNISESSTIFSVVESPNISGENPKILAPVSGNVSNSAIPFQFYIPASFQNKNHTIKLQSKKIGGRRGTIIQLSGNEISSSGIVSGVWNAEENGEYDVILEITSNAAPVIAPKIRVNITE